MGVVASDELLLNLLTAGPASTFVHDREADLEHCKALRLLTASLEKTMFAERHLGLDFWSVRLSEASDSDSEDSRDREIHLNLKTVYHNVNDHV